MRNNSQSYPKHSGQSASANNWQAGVGMLEVLVSLLLVAMSVLAFSGLQLQALRLTQSNTQLTAAADIAADFKGRYINMVAVYSGATAASKSMHKLSKVYMDEFAKTAGAGANSKVCTATGVTCTLTEVVASDAAELKATAKALGMSLGLVKCAQASESNSVSPPVCLLVAWGDTKPEKGDGAKQCITDNDVYHPTATCYRAEGVI